MFNFSKYAILSILFVASSASIAAEKIVICHQDTQRLSQLFAHNWRPAVLHHNFISYVKENNFSGALHTLTHYLPHDKNPHLHFSQINVQKIEDYNLWQVDCLYPINNPLMSDKGDGNLHLTTAFNATNYQCKKINFFTVKCGN